MRRSGKLVDWWWECVMKIELNLGLRRFIYLLKSQHMSSYWAFLKTNSSSWSTSALSWAIPVTFFWGPFPKWNSWSHTCREASCVNQVFRNELAEDFMWRAESWGSAGWEFRYGGFLRPLSLHIVDIQSPLSVQESHSLIIKGECRSHEALRSHINDSVGTGGHNVGKSRKPPSAAGRATMWGFMFWIEKWSLSCS